MAKKDNAHSPGVTAMPFGRMEAENASRPGRGSVRWTVGVIVRLCIWYTLLTPFLRCPSQISDLTESSPAVCKPYLVARYHVEPYILPYYDTYAAPYVEITRPYAQAVNQRILIPAAQVARYGYDKYGAPRLTHARMYGEKQWGSQVVPRIHSVQASLNDLYRANVGPYVQRVASVVQPQYEMAGRTLTTVYSEYIVPYYSWARPYAEKTLSSGKQVFTANVMPLVYDGWSYVLYFANSSLWPTMTGLYSENVEPQLVKIGQRLASYREGTTLRAAVDDGDSISEEPTPSSTLFETQATSVTSVTGTITSADSVTSVKRPKLHATTTRLSPERQAEQTRDRVTSDLQQWQEKFAVAADKGTENLKQRVAKIVEYLMASSENSHGESLVQALNSVVEHQLSDVRHRINTLAGSLPPHEASVEEENAQDELLKQIRQAALSIRQQAHALREWYRSFEEDLLRRVSAAVDTTVNILDSIWDLGLQEIGMRWAWMDGITYEHWVNYHGIKAQRKSWHNEVRDVGINHAKLAEARSLTNDVMEHGMNIAEVAANELNRLREVGKWKIAAREISDNFDVRSEPPPPLPKPRSQSSHEPPEGETTSVSDSVPEAVVFAPTLGLSTVPTISNLEGGRQSADAAMPSSKTQTPSSAQESPFSVDGMAFDSTPASPLPDSGSTTLPAGYVEVGNSLDDSKASVSKSVWGGAAAQSVLKRSYEYIEEDDERVEFPATPQSVVSQASENYAEVARAVSEALLRPSSTPEISNQAVSVSSDRYEAALSAASSVLYGTSLSSGERLSSAASDQFSDAVAAASSIIYGTAQAPLQSAMGQATAVLSDSADQAKVLYEIAKSQILSQMAQASLPLHSQLLSSIESAYSGSLECATKAAERAKPSLASATPSKTETLEYIFSIASSRLSDSLSVASELFAQVEATTSRSPANQYNQILLDPRRRYYEAIGLAHDQFSAFVSKASQGIHELPTPTSMLRSSFDDLIEDAKSHYSLASSMASVTLAAALDSASSAINAGETGTTYGIVAAASSQYQAALSAASSSLSSASASASSAIYGSPTGPVDALRTQASQNWEQLLSKVSGQVYGTQTPFIERASSSISQHEAVRALVSELLVGREPDFSNSVLGRLQAAYETAPASPIASASSYISDTYATASSAVLGYVTSIPTVDDILDAVSEQIDSAVVAASAKIYDPIEQTTSAAAGAYKSESASEAVGRNEHGHMDSAKEIIAEACSSAQSALNSILSQPVIPAQSALSSTDAAYTAVMAGAADEISAASLAVQSAASEIQFKASTAIYGQPLALVQSASSRLAAAVQRAHSRLEDLESSAHALTSAAASTASSQVEEATSAVKSAIYSS